MEPTISKGPSKTFLKRGGIAVGIIAIVLLIQTDFIKNIFTKNGAKSRDGIPIAGKTVGEVIGADSNENGIADWEERLWGLDPTVAFTDGVSNKQIIEEKKKNLAANGQTEATTETDAVARGIFSLATALSQSSDLTNEDINAAGKELGEAIRFEQAAPTYFLKDIKTIKTTTAALTAYYNQFGTISARYANLADFDLVISALETQDFSQMERIRSDAPKYEAFAQELMALSVPVGITEYHLAIVNGIHGTSVAFVQIAELRDDGVKSAQGINLYQQHLMKLQRGLFNLELYFNRYGIIQT